MPATIVHTQITVSRRPTGAYEVKIMPPVARVPNNDGVTDAKLVWSCTGGSLLGFDWKLGSGQPTVSLNASGELESAVYTKNTGTTSTKWEYEFTVQVGGGGPTLIIDPEVENLPPGQP